MARYITCSRRQREERERAEQEARQSSIRSRLRSNSGTSRTDRRNQGQNARRPVAPSTSMGPGFVERVQAFNRDAEEDPDRFFIIESLLGKRYTPNGTEEYLVRWLNYPPEYDTWEPRAELEKNSLAMINDFNKADSQEARELHCICQRPYKAKDGGMIQCFTCSKWFHFSCLQMNMAEANSYQRWHCDRCRDTKNLRNIIKRNKVRTLYGNTQLVDIEQEEADLDDEGQMMI